MSTPAPAAERLVSLDAFRGFIMVAMASAGLGFAKVAKSFPDSSAWQFWGYQFDHAPWRGCAFWDLIQPSFMFMVGVAMAYSYAHRATKGDSDRRMLGHAAFRAVLLTALGVFLSSTGSSQTNFTFVNVLSQIGMGYLFLFLLWDRPTWVQATAAAVILIGYWGFFAVYPAPAADVPSTSIGLPEAWPRLTGFEAHWEKNNNAAAAVDRWFLNLFPREKPYELNEGGYQTLNFIPSLATMIFGLMTGELLRSPRSRRSKLGLLIILGLAGLAVGGGIDAAGLCPIVKRIWTPSWAIFSTGWALLMLAGFYALIDVAGQRTWAMPLVVVGMNSIAMYMMSQMMKPWVRDNLKRHISPNLYMMFGATYEPIVQTVAVLAGLWLICWWLYRQKIFVRI